MPELQASILGRELPIYSSLHSIAIFAPQLSLTGELLPSGDATIQALSAHGTELDFRHVQPTAMFGSAVNPQPLGQAASLVRVKGFIERARLVRVEVVTHQDELGRIRKILFQKLLHLQCPIQLGPPLAHTHFAPGRQRLNEQKQGKGRSW